MPTPQEIAAEFAKLPIEERQRCLHELQTEPQFADFATTRARVADSAANIDTIDSPTQYQLGTATIPAPSPSWYERVAHLESPFMQSESEEEMLERLTDTDIKLALYVMHSGAPAMRPYHRARRSTPQAIADAQGDIEVAADEWYETTRASITDAMQLLARILADHPYPHVIAEKKTAEE